MAFTIAYEFTGEVYPTHIRAKGLGFSSSFGKIGSIIMPYIGIYISEIGLYIPYFIFGITSLIASVVTFFLPFDTAGIELDKINHNNKWRKNKIIIFLK